jgi:hypothetical protein
MSLSRTEAEALYRVFNRFALEDQRMYYKATILKCRTAAKQVNQLRALFSLLTGLSSALAGLLVATTTADNAGMGAVVVGLLVVAIVAPVIGTAFGTLSDLYQWDRLTTVYESALQNIEVADALSPDAEEDTENYTAALQAFTEGTLAVMRDESAQWGQLIRPPRQIEEFLEAQQKRLENGTDGSRSGTPPPPQGGAG